MNAGALPGQDTIYTYRETIKNVRIINNGRELVIYRLPDDINADNMVITKKDIRAVSTAPGLHELIIRDTDQLFHSVYFKMGAEGDTVWLNPDYDPSGISSLDLSVKLCRFKNDKEYTQY